MSLINYLNKNGMIIIFKVWAILFALSFIVTGLTSYIKMVVLKKDYIKIVTNLFSATCAFCVIFLYTETLFYEIEEKKIRKRAVLDSVQVDTIPFMKIKATYYNPTSGQCDKTPLITGSGYKINLRKLKKKDIKVVALSRDLLKIYPYNSEIYVHQPVHLRGYWKVEDTMNKRFTKRIDFLVYDKLNVDSVHISL